MERYITLSNACATMVEEPSARIDKDRLETVEASLRVRGTETDEFARKRIKFVLGLSLLLNAARDSPLTPSEIPARKIFDVPIPATAAISARSGLKFNVTVEIA